jgi:hypothetical protein
VPSFPSPEFDYPFEHAHFQRTKKRIPAKYRRKPDLDKVDLWKPDFEDADGGLDRRLTGAPGLARPSESTCLSARADLSSPSLPRRLVGRTEISAPVSTSISRVTEAPPWRSRTGTNGARRTPALSHSKMTVPSLIDLNRVRVGDTKEDARLT